MANEKWTQVERKAAIAELWSFGDPTKAHFYAVASEKGIDLACQRNALRDALERLRPLIWDDIKRGHGLFSDKDLEVTDAVLAKCK